MTGLSPRELLTAASRHRDLLAGGLVAAAVAIGLGVLTPAPPATVTVLSAARDLPGGTLLTGADLRPVHLPVGLAPSGAVTGARAAVGQVLSGQPAGLLAVLLRVTDPATAAVVRAGDRVEVLGAATDRAGATAVVASAILVTEDLTVLAVPRPAQDSAEGALLVVATYPETARRQAGAAVGHRLSAVVR